jgi:adenosylmethionine-8-amino-7-oxononanoate aminotransferase
MKASTRDLIDLDTRYVWHPFTQMREWADEPPLVIERAEGNYLIDTDGRRYLDGVSSLWVLVHGHGRPEIVAAIRDQAERVCHSTLLGLANVPAAQLAERLVAIAPAGLSKVFYSDSGSTAVEIALKMAFQYWQQVGRPEKRRFICLDNAYHGDTIGAVSVGGIDLFHGIFGPLLFETIRVPATAEALGAALRRDGESVAAFLVEPLVQGAAGVLLQPPGFLAEAARLCRAHDVLLIADEVATGFGRTGRMFACEHEGVTPDFLCLAKGLTGGTLPLAATLTTGRVYEAFLGKREDNRQFFHGHTYTGNPVACAAALASLAIFEREPVLECARSRADQIQAALCERVAKLPSVKEIRQRGLMIGVELAVPGAGRQVCRRMRDLGVIVRPLGDVVVLMPPLSITQAEAASLVAALAQAIADVCA